MRAQVFVPALLLFVLMLSGCADKQALPPLMRGMDGRVGVDIPDPEGPIPPPTIPPDLAAEAKAQPAPPAPDPKNAMTYAVECGIEETPPRKEGQKSPRPDGQTGGQKDGPEENPPPAPGPGEKTPEEDARDTRKQLVETFQKTSILYRLADTPPDSLIGLEQRLAVALEEARDVLRSYGYYAGRVRGRVERAASGGGSDPRAVVRITFLPGPQYRMGVTTVVADLPPSLEKEEPRLWQKLPRTLADAGLEEGSPARAADVLAAVDRARNAFLNNGFPFAAATSTRYFADHAARTLEAEVRITPGAFVRMGDIEREGAQTVRNSYFQNMRVWRKGRPWNQERIETLRENLRGAGLFQSIDIAPGEREDEDGNRPVAVTLRGAPERTVSAAVKYHSDFGPGLQANWEHRNLTGRGDSLRLALPLWLDMQEMTANYRLPYFLRRDQDFLAGGGVLNQDTDAYRVTSGAFSAGVERRLSRWWSAFVKGSVEGGTIKEPDEPGREYLMLGLPLGLAYDNTGSLLNAVRGWRVMMAATPYTGSYDKNFTAVRTRVDAQSFIPVLGEDRLTLALRGVLGAIAGSNSGDVPPSVRFYSGGGGSVRGYEYQSIGPRNDKDKPLGGGSLAEMSVEARYKFTPEWGAVAFVDGGTVYDNVFEDATRTMRFGAGVGIRLYTAIGPVRADLATPLNPRDDDDLLQFYISIGQSF